MAGKSFKGYGSLWSGPNEPEKEDKQAHDKKKKQTPKKEKAEPQPLRPEDANKETPVKSVKQAHNKNNKEAHDNPPVVENKETPIKKRGRPKMDASIKKAHFNLLLRPDTIAALNRVAGQRQVDTGRKVVCWNVDFLTSLKLLENAHHC